MINVLPEDILLNIMKYLYVSDITSLFYTSKTIRNSIQRDDVFIYDNCLHKHPHKVITEICEKTGKISFIPYLDGVKHGKFRKFYKNGNLNSEYWFRYNKMEGEFKYFYSTGELNIHGWFKNDMENGLFTIYNRSGDTIVKTLFVDNKIVKRYI